MNIKYRKILISILLAMPLFLFGACSSSKIIKSPAAKTKPVEELFASAVNSYNHSRYEEAESSFKSIAQGHPLSPFAKDAQIMLADLLYTAQRYDDAISAYTKFYKFHPTHEKAPYALFQKGMSLLRGASTIDRDLTPSKKALFAFAEFLKLYPESIYAGKASEVATFLEGRLATREFYIGEFYYDNENYKGALWRFAEILKRYPEAGLTDKALYFIGETYDHLGEDELSKDAFLTLLSDFPKSPLALAAKERLKKVS
ncbi:MAG: outer membrane protein assembly factor BamD [Deltaproteobacteria bacterium]|nr:outer membrane protein assembly factor BamD [Deltaproteobacteria bacterium]